MYVFPAKIRIWNRAKVQSQAALVARVKWPQTSKNKMVKLLIWHERSDGHVVLQRKLVNLKRLKNVFFFFFVTE